MKIVTQNLPLMNAVKQDDQGRIYIQEDKLMEANHSLCFTSRERRCFCSNIGIGKPFCYLIEDRKTPSDTRPEDQETGIGALYEEAGGVYLNKVIVSHGIEKGQYFTNAGSDIPHHTKFDKDATLTMTIGKWQGDIPNGVRVGDDILIVDKDSVIYCDKDYNVDSISIDDFVKLFANKSPQFSATTLKPSNRPKRPRKGTIIFNKNNSKFEGYDGKDWKEL